MHVTLMKRLHAACIEYDYYTTGYMLQVRPNHNGGKGSQAYLEAIGKSCCG